MAKKLPKEERHGLVTKGYLHDLLDEKDYISKDWTLDMFETYDKRAQDRIEALMEDNQHKFEALIEAFNFKFEVLEDKIDGFGKRLLVVENKLSIT